MSRRRIWYLPHRSRFNGSTLTGWTDPDPIGFVVKASATHTPCGAFGYLSRGHSFDAVDLH
jgi:hypothetical protein